MAQQAAAPEELIGRTFHGRFRIDGLLGRGGMGAVFKAQQLSMDKPIALKVLAKSLAEEEKQIQRFKQEGMTSSQLKHPNTIRVIDYGQSADGYLYLAMELLEGTELNNVIKTGGAMDPARAVRIARQICKSVGEAHEMGLVHRDLKPGNIFLCDFFGEKDFVKVLDFGIAKFMEEQPGQESLTQTGFICGTPLYIAPEQALGRPVSAATDLYSLGAILYEMLCGQPPFRADTPIAIVMRHIHDQPVAMQQFKSDLVLPPELEELVFHMLSKDPRQRPASAHEVGLALEDILSAGVLTGGPAASQGRIRMPTGRRLGETSSAQAGSFADLNTRSVSESSLAELSAAVQASSSSSTLSTASVGTSPAETGIDTGSEMQGASKGWLWAAALVVLLGGGGVAAYLLSQQGATGESATAVIPKDRAADNEDSPSVSGEGIKAGAAKPAASVAVDAPDRGITADTGQSADTESASGVAGDSSAPGAVVAEAVVAEPLKIPLMTTPPGAEVTRGASLLGNTPLTVELGANDPVLKFTLRKQGFQSREIELDYHYLMKTADPAAPLSVSMDPVAAPVVVPVVEPKPPGKAGKKSKKRKRVKGKRNWGSSW